MTYPVVDVFDVSSSPNLRIPIAFFTEQILKGKER